MHKIYGPIVRINPRELHIKDSQFFSSIYAGASGGRRTDKDPAWANMAGAPRSAFSTLAHDVHRERRAALNPFFSKKKVSELEPRVAKKVEILCARFRELVSTGHVVRMHVAASAFTMDVISEYCYGEDGCTNYLLDPEFKPEWAQTIQDVFDDAAFRRVVPWLISGLQRLPLELVLRMMPSMEVLLRWQAGLKGSVEAAIREYNAIDGKEQKETIFLSLLDNDELPAGEKSVHRLADEAEILVAAGSETTARTIAYTIVHVLRTPGVLEKLKAVLEKVMPNKDVLPTWNELEKVPYLTGVVQEGLRLAFGVTTRSPRCAHEDVRYGEWVIPAMVSLKLCNSIISSWIIDIKTRHQ
jgi:cytochrome P450